MLSDCIQPIWINRQLNLKTPLGKRPVGVDQNRTSSADRWWKIGVATQIDLSMLLSSITRNHLCGSAIEILNYSVTF
jgi:hypothetical protein